MDSKNSGAEKKRKRCSFNAAEKVRLAGQVQENPCIWDLSHPKHFNMINVSNAWSGISVVMEKSVEECKENWAALRDGKRYRMKSAVRRKSGDAGGSPIPGESFDDDWEFGKAMQFLPDNSKKRKTLDSSGTDGAMEDVLAQGTSKSKYIYNEHRSSTPLVEDVNVDNLNALIESQLQRNNDKKIHRSYMENILTLKYQGLYLHMDAMLSRLPQEKVDRVHNKILNLITEELYSHE